MPTLDAFFSHQVLDATSLKEIKNECPCGIYNFNAYVGTVPESPIDALDDWIALLSIATRFVFDRVRELALAEVARQVLDPVRRIALAEAYSVPQWLPPAFMDLIKRAEPLGEPEAESLGMRSVVRVARAREEGRERAAPPEQRTRFVVQQRAPQRRVGERDRAPARADVCDAHEGRV